MTHPHNGTDASAYPFAYRNLMAVGLLGAIYRAHDDANTVNAAVELTLADPAPFRLCRAIAQGMGGDGSYAASALNDPLQNHPDDDGAKVAMAVALMLAGDARWRPLIDNVLATSTDPTAREAANGVLACLDTIPPH